MAAITNDGMGVDSYAEFNPDTDQYADRNADRNSHGDAICVPNAPADDDAIAIALTNGKRAYPGIGWRDLLSSEEWIRQRAWEYGGPLADV